MPNKLPFRVTHASGQDDNYKAIELNMHSPTTKGWQSSRFSLYPQEIVVQLDNKARIKKIQLLSHQYLIASKVEFYVGDVPDNESLNLGGARYTRLGYVALSDNKPSNCKARELKSVHVDATGTFVKFIIHKNHVNKFNIYNQVGLVALNIIGDTIDDIEIINSTDDENLNLNQKIARVKNNSDQISAMDDLAFDMYQDPEIAQIIRKLEVKKQLAVAEEQYEHAKEMKFAVLELQKCGEKLGKYEVEKRQAVENEDYDKAKEMKDTIDKERLGIYKDLQIHSLLEKPTKENQRRGSTQISPPSPYGRRSVYNDTASNHDELILPAIVNSKGDHDCDDDDDDGGVDEDGVDGSPAKNEETLRNVTPYEDRPLLPGDQRAFTEAQDDEAEKKDENNEVMSDKDQRNASTAIDVFDLELVTKCYSKLWSSREQGLQDLRKAVMSGAVVDKESSRSILRASIFLINRSLKDKVLTVFNMASSILKMIYTEFIPKHKLGRSEIIHTCDKTLPILLQRFGDTALRVRESATKFIIESSKFNELKTLHLVPNECQKSFKLSIAPRTALKRVDLMTSLYEIHGLDNSGMSVNSIMAFCNEALKHHAGEVREAAEALVVKLYKDAGQSVRDWLPPDDDRTRRNVMYKLIFEAFDEIDGVPKKIDKKKAQAVKQKEIQDLQEQLAHVRDMNSQLEKQGKAKGNKKKGIKDRQNANNNKPPSEQQAVNSDSMCIFCNEQNEAFVKTEGLDTHYFRDCAMLKRCSNCNTVVEISGLTNHLLGECTNSSKYRKCSLCSEAILSTELEKHITDKKHTSDEANKSHCPLCHRNFGPIGEEAWKQHLMSDASDSCKMNPRRVESLNRLSKAGGKSNRNSKKTTAK